MQLELGALRAQVEESSSLLRMERQQRRQAEQAAQEIQGQLAELQDALNAREVELAESREEAARQHSSHLAAADRCKQLEDRLLEVEHETPRLMDKLKEAESQGQEASALARSPAAEAG